MLPRKKLAVLKAISKSIDAILQKIDIENKEFVSGMNLDDKQKKLALKALDNFEKKIQAFFIEQKKEYLSRIKELPVYMVRNRRQIRHKIKKKEVPEEMIDNIAEIMAGFIFVNEKKHIKKLEALYKAFTGNFFSEIAEICARSVEGSKLGKTMSLSDKATSWLDQQTIKFAQKVNQTTHDAVIKSLKDGLSESKGSNLAGNNLVTAVPNHFHQDKLKQKSQKLESVLDANKYNIIYQSVEKQQCFEFYRARRIARTELNSATNAATVEGWRQSEVIEGKEWLCACDQVSRDWHKNANSQQVPLEEPFLVGGEKLMHPGDSSQGASAKNIVHCRCSMKSILRYKEGN